LDLRKSLTGELSEQIEGLDPPILLFACPIDHCPVWHAHITELLHGTVKLMTLAETATIWRHEKEEHGDNLAAHPELQALFA